MVNATPVREVVESMRAQLELGRKTIREQHDRGVDGQRICASLTTLVDGILIRLLESTLASLPELQVQQIQPRFAVVALGSYGRRQMSPYSDVDVMLLHDMPDEEQLTSIVRPFTQALYDVGFELGYSVRTVAEAVALAQEDAVIATSQIGSRLVVGNHQLHQTFQSQYEKSIRRRPKVASVAILEARREERDKYGKTVYLLEPNVKRSRGGLRDLHLLQWLGFIDHGEYDLDRLHTLRAFSKRDYHRLNSAKRYMLRLRHELHFHSGMANEVLNRAEQLRMAEVFGHTERNNLLPVEHFMRDYFRHTKHIWEMIRRREAALHTRSTVEKLLDPVIGRSGTRDYLIGLKNVTLTTLGREKVQAHLGTVLDVVAASSQTGKFLDHATWSTMLLAAPECPDAITPTIAEKFLQLLDDPKTAGDSLRLLNELGYLEKFVPAMKHARCLLQFNQYHKYTVDEHCLLSVRKAGEFVDRKDILGQAYREVKEKRLLHLALLLHDLGKGFDEDHSEVGSRIATEMCERLLLNKNETDVVSKLVLKHLTMSHLTFRRDTSDPAILQRFAEEIGSTRRVRMLFVLTCADLAAVGPDILNDWKTEVLGDVFSRTLRLLKPDKDGSQGDSELEEYRQRLTTTLTEQERENPWFQRQIELLPGNYLAGRELEEVAEALRAMSQLTAGQAVAWGKHFPETQTVEFIAGISHGVGKGTFSNMAGVLTSQSLKILAADVEILADDLLILRYVASDPVSPTQTSPERIAKIARLLVEKANSDEPPRFPKVWGEKEEQASIRLTALPNNVRVDNVSSERGTVFEIFTFDRPGLLYFLAHRLHELGLTIRHAKIGTYLDQVVDVFYVTDRQGAKLTNPEQLESLQKEMLEVVEADWRNVS